MYRQSRSSEIITEDDVDEMNNDYDQRVVTDTILMESSALVFLESSEGTKTFVHYCIYTRQSKSHVIPEKINISLTVRATKLIFFYH